MTCQTFLQPLEKRFEALSALPHTADNIAVENEMHYYENLQQILKKIQAEVELLLQDAYNYQGSLIGTFHTTAYLEEIKKHLSEIRELKTQWKDVFRTREKLEEEKKATALEELHQMIGMQTVKNRINDFYQFLKFQKKRKELGFQMKDEMSLNMIITGNPGTGKTTLARLFAKIYHELGVLPREEVIETDRIQLVGSYVGQTEENVRTVVEKALGGVLFIDEAYNLKREGQSGNDYGQTVIDTLVSLMTGSEYGGKFAVILAGYPDEMRYFLDANPGLRSRFPTANFITLPDYTNQELIGIGAKLAADNDFLLTDEAVKALEERIERERGDDSFGNARTVRNLVLDAIFKKGTKQRKESFESFLDYSLLDKEDFLIESHEIKEHPQEKLAALIGLNNVKEEVRSIISYVKMQNVRREHGLPVLPLQLHTVFTGNPSTGKTTVAKIYVELLKECGLLKRGHLLITSRADFVAGYVGQTAAKTKRKIREALGGVLFIDEAYSLLGHSAGDFGKEDIDTLVDEMTKHNENLVVILAGYACKMENLLKSNPGLQSHFKKFIHFPDYSAEELLQIMKSYAKRFDYHLTKEAKNHLLKNLNNKDIYGNGRFAVNLITEAIQLQAHRLTRDTEQMIDMNKATMLEKEDIEKAFEKVKRGE